MKKILPLLLALLLFTACTPADKPEPVRDTVNTAETAANYTTETPPEAPDLNGSMKAVWISYIELSRIISGHTEEEFSAAFALMCRNAAGLGINTLFVHVRAFSDSLYPSTLYPKSNMFDTEDFDALEIMVETAHRFGLALHAWINPLRCATKENAAIYNGTLIGEWISDPTTYDEYICYLEGDGHYWLNPAVPEVRALIAAGAAEIVRGYDVDGVHIDDYFYPTDEPFFDAGRYVESGTSQPLSQWRQDNCSLMVRGIYSAVKGENSRVLFGVSPQGNIANNYTYLCADVRRWCTEAGFLDYIAPQIYYGYENPKKPFAEALEEWVSLCEGREVSLVIGVAAYKLAAEDEYISNVGILGRQISDALESADGAALYSYDSLFSTSDSRVYTELEYIKAALSGKNLE